MSTGWIWSCETFFDCALFSYETRIRNIECAIFKDETAIFNCSLNCKCSIACCSCAVRVRQCRLCIPGLKKTACVDPVAELNPTTGSRDPWAPRPKRSCGSKRLVYSLTFQTHWKQERLWKHKKSRFRNLKSQSHERTKFFRFQKDPSYAHPYHIISHHITSYHIISHHVTSYHIISHHITSYHIISHHITSYHYEPFKGPDGLLSPRMVSSSAFHLRPDCQCLTVKTTVNPTAFAGGVFEFSVTRSSSLGIQLEVEDISELLGRLLHLLLVLLTVRANIEYLCYKS